MEKEKVLLVEDDQRLGELQRDYLLQQGFDVLWRRHGREMNADLGRFAPDIIVLDLGLPGVGGIDICRDIRQKFFGKILILTSSSDDIDHVTCLELGADDYVSKPINPRVLLARIRTLLRREELINSEPCSSASNSLQFGELVLKNLSQEVMLAEERVKLSNSEFKLLWFLASHADEVVERSVLFKGLRGIEFDGMDRSVDTKIVALRKKLGDSSSTPRRIITIRNKGYLFCSDSW
ncbi:MAG: response regulator [Agarilytica sp.]